MMLTEFGKAVRKLRIDLSLTLRDMAEELGVSPAYLSGVETGRKNVGENLVKGVIQFFARKGVDAEHLIEAAQRSRKEVRLRMSKAREDQQDLAVALARRFEGEGLSRDEVKEIMTTLNEKPRHGRTA